MKITTSILTTVFALLMMMPSTVAASYYADADGWPSWIGRNDDLYATYKQRPEMAAKFIPLSLVKTGGFEKIVTEVEGTANVDTTKWSNWIDELAN